MSKRKRSNRRRRPGGLVILHEDRDLIVVDKPAGLLTVATEWEKDRTARQILTDYVRKGEARSRKEAYVVHRLDRDTSGVLVFAKSEKACQAVKDDWVNTNKKYLAVVHGRAPEREGLITSYLLEDENYVVASTADREKGKLSRTAYRVLKETGKYSLLEIDLLTGRKNQIRVHLSEAGCPIVGDTKYGRAGDTFPHLALHARSISLAHPFSKNRLYFEATVPPCFGKLVGDVDV